MHVHITELALERIESLKGEREGQMHLFYETEGCGCGNSGIFEIRYVTETTPEDVEIDSNLGPILIKNWTKVFLDEQMKIDFLEDRRTLVLKSDGQVFNSNLLVTDGTGCQLNAPSR
ncbi:iron-sulfur cluster biosynthesis family protein [Exiguobacterium qingdaonense]|uniref:iron-sulfur cluster biosynthesis family protein n=1 Tax=Exiguobacterium qingdaonense TaxID=2751251 RepID=UPI001BE9ED8D|nr:iron-sulfur cluster biosynthesis family protein [Exiguobacterium qingdaonense]